jgi:hypothetical protein
LTPPPHSTQRVCPPPQPKAGGGGTHSPGGEGGGVNILEDARHWIGLFHYNPSTVTTLPSRVRFKQLSSFNTWLRYFLFPLTKYLFYFGRPAFLPLKKLVNLYKNLSNSEFSFTHTCRVTIKFVCRTILN